MDNKANSYQALVESRVESPGAAQAPRRQFTWDSDNFTMAALSPDENTLVATIERALSS